MKGATAPEAAEVVHPDFPEGFIKAVVAAYAGSWWVRGA
ncbi:DUF933 domain-containing protein [Streptomyces longwoodensis]